MDYISLILLFFIDFLFILFFFLLVKKHIPLSIFHDKISRYSTAEYRTIIKTYENKYFPLNYLGDSST